MKGIIIIIFMVSIISACTNPQINQEPDNRPNVLLLERSDPAGYFDGELKKDRIGSSKKVREIYDAMNHFNIFPTGFRSCRADIGVSYTLSFMHDDDLILRSIVRATGCRDVTFGDDTFLGDDAQGDIFFGLLRKSLGITTSEFTGLPIKVELEP